MHIRVSKLIITGLDNELSPDRHQAIIWTNAGILISGPLGINFCENSTLNSTQKCLFVICMNIHTTTMGVWNPWRVYLTPRTYNIYKQNIDLISWNGHVSRCAMQSWTSHWPSEPHPVASSELFTTKWRSTGRCDNHQCGKVCQTDRVVI